jgi:hypothetical protein
MEVIAGQVTAPGGTLTALTMNAGNSATVRNAALTAPIYLLQTWARNNAAGIWQIKSPKLHDNVQGIRYRVRQTDPTPLWARFQKQRLVPQDTLTLNLSGSAVGGQIEQAAALIYYTDLPGAASHFIGLDELLKRTNNVWTTEIAITPGAAGGYSGQVAINSTFDNFKANTEYALVGYEVDAQCSVVGFTSPDFGNYRVGGPGLTALTAGQLSTLFRTSEWFISLTREYGIPLIPVFNAANKFSTLVDIMQNQTATAVNVTAILHELAPPGANGFSSGQ